MKVIKPQEVDLTANGEFYRNTFATYMGHKGDFFQTGVGTPRMNHTVTESRTNYAPNSEDWTLLEYNPILLGLSRDLTKSYKDSPFTKITRVTPDVGYVVQQIKPIWWDQKVTVTFTVLAGNSNVCSFGLYFNLAGKEWGSIAENIPKILSGPGSLIRNTDSVVTLSGLSQTEPTTVTLTRSINSVFSGHPVSFLFYPHTVFATGAGGEYVYATRLHVESGELSTEYIETNGSPITVDTIDATGLLVEKDAINYIQHSNELSSGAWFNSGITIATSGSGPLFGSSASRLSPTSNISSQFYLGYNLTLSPNTDYTYSFFAKAGEYASLVIETVDLGNVFSYTNVHLDTGTVQVVNGSAAATIEKYKNGWYRVSVTINTRSGAGDPRFVIFLTDHTFTPTFIGETTRGIYVSAFQIEIASKATSYIPTSGAIGVRYADLIYTPLQNRLLQSENFSATTAWTPTNLTVLPSTTYFQSGLTRVKTHRLTDNGITGYHLLLQNVANTLDNAGFSPPAYISVIAKAETLSNLGISLQGVGLVNFNLSTGAATTVSGIISFTQMLPLGGGWYKCTFGGSLNASTTVVQFFLGSAPGNYSYAGTGQSLLVSHANLSSGSVSAYIKTKDTMAVDPVSLGATRDGHALIYSSVTDFTDMWNSGNTYTIGRQVLWENSIYECIANSPTGASPSDDVTHWFLVGPANTHAALDSYIDTSTVAPYSAVSPLMFIVSSYDIDSLALINTKGKVVSVSVTNQTGQILMSKTFRNEDFSQYAIQNILNLKQRVYIAVEVHNDTLTGGGSVGSLVFGNLEDLGSTSYGFNSGITDYSVKETDAFGTTTFVKRRFSKKLSADIYFSNSSLNRIQKFLSEIRATPVVWIASDDPELTEAAVVLGFYKDFSTTIAYPDNSLCSLEIEGLT